MQLGRASMYKLAHVRFHRLLAGKAHRWYTGLNEGQRPAKEEGVKFAQRLDEMLTGLDSLPTLPSIVWDLRGALEEEGTDALEIARIIETDPGLAAKTLSVANSSYFGFATPATTLPEAVARLGFDTIRELCTTVAVVRVFLGCGRALDHQRFWQHSLSAAFISRIIARLSGKPAQMPEDEAYVAGLLHDVGALILDQYFPEEFVRTRDVAAERAITHAQAEREVLGMDHGEVGGRLLRIWNLPGVVVQAVAFHHRPSEAKGDRPGLAEVLHLAEFGCLMLDEGEAGDPYSPLSAERTEYTTQVEAGVYVHLGFGRDEVTKILAQLTGETEKAAELFAAL